MNIALDEITGKRIVPEKGITGICQFCKSEMIAKCGKIKIHHWAHKSVDNCDKWWESETEWHKVWKNKFPTEWQEKVMKDDQTGEKHIADIYNSDKKLTIEFQNSSISSEELLSREQFYKRMIWVISSKQMEISTSPLQTLITDINRIVDNFYSDRINPHIRISEPIRNELRMMISGILKKENIGIREIEQFIREYNDRIDDLCGNIQHNRNTKEYYNPNESKKELLQPLIMEITKRIQRIQTSDQCFRYKQIKGSRTWQNVSSPLFLDTGSELKLLYGNEIGKTVPKNKFLNYYSKNQIKNSV